MLQNAHAYVKLPASDAQRAKRFYVDILGFTPQWEMNGHIWLNHADGSSILVFPSTGKASGDHDQCGWVVDDIETEVADLRSRGVVFEEFAGRRFVDGIAVDGPFMAAWFRDSEGNLLNVRSKASREAEAYGRR
jgi:catechol 2,3-dioxygenase-like lactoylglutathione lyase family enzyme